MRSKGRDKIKTHPANCIPSIDININSELKTLQEKIKGKLKMLNFTVEDTAKILQAEYVRAIERHGSALESIIDKMHQLKLQVQELRIKNDDDAAKIRNWSETLEAHIGKFEETLKEVKHVATGIRLAEEEKCEEEKQKKFE